MVTWGVGCEGGNSDKVKEALVSGVAHIYCTTSAFAALKADGSVVTWGNDRDGGNSEKVKAALASGVMHIAASDNAFAALKVDGSVVTWGSRFCGEHNVLFKDISNN